MLVTHIRRRIGRLHLGRGGLSVVVFGVILTASCQTPVEPDGRPRDVLLVTIDTARADRFSYTGRSPVVTAAVDSVAADGVAFLDAVSPVPITLPAHASLMTGRNPPGHGVRSNGIFRLAPGQVTLAELLTEAGYHCAAFVGAAVLEARYGLDQGFQHYDDSIDPSDRSGRLGFAQRRAELVVDAALEWLDRDESDSTFVWVHLFDPHSPYAPPEPERSSYESAYDGEIAYTDRMIARLLDGYRSRGRYDSALVIVTADHGESLGEHGERSHGMFVYDATVRIPLVLRAPNLPSGRRVDEQVRLIDVMATVTDLLGLPAPVGIDGTSLMPLIDGDESKSRPDYLETMYPRLHHGWSESRALRRNRWKLIESAGRELYDLAADPFELDDRVAREPERIGDLVARLDSAGGGESEGGGAALEIDSESRRKLAALGYLASSPPTDGIDELPDTRTRIHLLGQMNDALKLFHEGHSEEGIVEAEAVVSEETSSPWFLRQLAAMYVADVRLADALDAYQRTVALMPDDIDAWTAMGVVLLDLGRHDDALVAFERALTIDPDDRRARHNRFSVLLRTGKAARAMAEARATLAQRPDDAEALWVDYRVNSAAAPTEERVSVLERALALASGDATLSLELAMVLEELGRLEEATRLYRQAIEQASHSDEAVYRLGRLLVTNRRWSEADQLLGTTSTRRTPELMYLVSEVRYRYGDLEGAVLAVRDVVRRQPRRVDAWSTLATLELERNDPQAAIGALDRVVALQPGNVATWARLAQLYEQIGMLDEAHHCRVQEQRATVIGSRP